MGADLISQKECEYCKVMGKDPRIVRSHKTEDCRALKSAKSNGNYNAKKDKKNRNDRKKKELNLIIQRKVEKGIKKALKKRKRGSIASDSDSASSSDEE